MITVNVNGKDHSLDVTPDTPLLWALRDVIGMTGTKFGCGIGMCGACTVHLNGRAVRSCITPLAAVADASITTIEGLAQGEALHPLQQAFIDQDAFQCGYCTPGQIMSAVACIREGHAGTDAEIREYMSGNLCRCGAYNNIVAAVRQAAEMADA